MKKVILSIVFGLFFVAFSTAQESTAKEIVKVETTVKADAYQCPMDCEKGKTYAKPGSCPVCKMDLKKVDANKKMSTCSGTPKKGCCASKKGAVKKESCSKAAGAAKKSCSSKSGAKAKKGCCSKKA